MNSKKKKILIITLVLVLLIGIVGITYAVFSYSQTGLNQELVTGDIYMHYKESNTLTLENALPSSTYDPNNYFEFQIVGKNTNTKYDIYYDINLNRGLVPTGKLEANRIQDKFLKFRLVEVVNNAETEIFTNKSYNDLSSATRIHVETINKNTMNEITKTYRLYMWISNDVVIGNTGNSGIDYDISTWNNLFGSIRVSVTGDFTEKSMEEASTDESCFTTVDNGDNTVTITHYNTEDKFELNQNMTNEELQVCVSYLTTLWGAEEEGNTVDVGETYQAFCDGTGTIWGNTFQFILDVGFFDSEAIAYFEEHNIVNISYACSTDSVVIPTTINGKRVTRIGDNAFTVVVPRDEWDEYHGYLESVLISEGIVEIGQHAFAGGQLTSVSIPSGVTTIGDEAFRDNRLTSVTIANGITTIGNSAFRNNQLTSVEIPDSVITIEDYVFFNNQLTSVTIPNSVTTIREGAFYGNQLTSVTIGNGITTIGDSAFGNNQLTSVEIPNSVTTIGNSAFSYNQLTNVTIGNGITSIGRIAFEKSNATSTWSEVTYYDNPNLASITINKSCNDIKNNLLSVGTNYYPWLSNNSPYTASGVTIYGSGNTVCDAF